MIFENLPKITLDIIRYLSIFVLTFNRFCWNFKPILLTICALQDSASQKIDFNKY